MTSTVSAATEVADTLPPAEPGLSPRRLWPFVPAAIVLNGLLKELGLISQPVDVFLYNDVGVFIVLLYVYFPFAALTLYSSLERFDFTQLTAAQDLGARPDQALRRVLLPQIRPGLITACIFVFIPILGEYLTPDLVGGTKGILIGSDIISFYLGGS